MSWAASVSQVAVPKHRLKIKNTRTGCQAGPWREPFLPYSASLSWALCQTTNRVNQEGHEP